METGSILLIIVGVVLLWLLVDILFTGGSMTGGMMMGMMTMAGHPVGWVVLLLLVALGALAAYVVFFT